MKKQYHKKRLLLSVIFFMVMIVLSVLIGNRQKELIGDNEFYKTVEDLTDGFYIKQTFSIIILFMIGRLFFAVFAENIERRIKMSMSFLVGIAVWCISAHVLMMSGIKYNILSACIFIGLIVCGGNIHRLLCKKGEVTYDLDVFMQELPGYFVVLGIAAFTPTGVLITMMSGDSYHYVAQFGQMIAKYGCYDKGTMCDFLTSTGISPAIICSLGELFGFESIYGIQHAAAISFIFSFYYLYNANNSGGKKINNWIMSLIPVIVLVSTLSVVVLMGWVISSSYWMFYNTFFIILCCKEDEQRAYFPVQLLFSCMLTITRAEAVLFVVFVIVFMLQELGTKKTYAMLLINMTLEMGLFYLVFICWEYEGSLFMSRTNACIFAVGMLVAIVYTYISNRYKGLMKYNKAIIIIGVWCMALVVTLVKREQVVNNLIVTIKNLSQDIWGVLVCISCITVVYLFCQKKLRIEKIIMLAACELIIGFLMNGIRYEGLREGIGDSFNRLVIGVLPLVVYSLSIEVFEERTVKKE